MAVVRDSCRGPESAAHCTDYDQSELRSHGIRASEPHADGEAMKEALEAVGLTSLSCGIDQPSRSEANISAALALPLDRDAGRTLLTGR
jgi:hypothetical protein